MSVCHHTYGRTCQLASPPVTASSPDAPPPIRAQFFYQSLLHIDDPLSPLPPPSTSAASANAKHPLRPFAARDNAALEEAWQGLKGLILGSPQEGEGSASTPAEAKRPASSIKDVQASRKKIPRTKTSEAVPIPPRTGSEGLQEFKGVPQPQRSSLDDGLLAENAHVGPGSRQLERDVAASPQRPFSNVQAHHDSIAGAQTISYSPSRNTISDRATTGTPFLRAPAREERVPFALHNKAGTSMAEAEEQLDWGSSRTSTEPLEPSLITGTQKRLPLKQAPSILQSVVEKPHEIVQVPVGVSRLHVVEFPDLDMKPIYWSPVNDISLVTRATWFYGETMLPVEADVANQLELGYLELKPWTETWNDELNSAVSVGAEGEAKVVHRIWPKEERKKAQSGKKSAADGPDRSSFDSSAPAGKSSASRSATTSGRAYQDLSHVAAEAHLDLPDGTVRRYANSCVLYKNCKEAFILRPGQFPSAYYGRRPVAKIRKGITMGTPVVRGFEWKAWHKLHPPKITLGWARSMENAAMSAPAAAEARRAPICHACAVIEQPQQVTDLILVIHGIGQKLSERIESFHFTPLVNSFRRQLLVELADPAVRSVLRPDHGGIMALPINWRSTVSLEDDSRESAPGRSSASSPDTPENEYTLKDITPGSLPALRNLISDVMLDIPYYLSHHKPKMIEAVIREANRVYGLWCKNNPRFERHGRVHLIAHSLGSVMALDILSKQPTHLPQEVFDRYENISNSGANALEINTKYLDFDTKSLFFCGSPAGFFLLLNRASLLPRKGRNKPGAAGEDAGRGVAGEAGTYGCLAIDNIYNVLNHLDPIAYRLNSTVDKGYAASLRPAFVPSASNPSFFGSIGSAFRLFKPSAASSPPASRGTAGTALASSSVAPAAGAAAVGGDTDEAALLQKPLAGMPRLPSSVELDIHDFSREEVIEKRMYLLNENGQIDYFLPAGGGPLEIQYLNMLGAHSSYWASRDFVRFVVLETGRVPGRAVTLPGMRAAKRKKGPASAAAAAAAASAAAFDT